jgi:saccharopine dehydrogenase-like NADP-dependent oxidoreductase
MKKILLFGAGRSATSLISYLVDKAETYNWFVQVADMSVELAKSKIQNPNRAEAVAFVADNEPLRQTLIKNADVVISMLPVSLHSLVASDCVLFSKSLFNASYISTELKELETDIIAKKLLFLCELGLDPGIDHMSAMKIIHELQFKKAEILSFRSYTGGLVAPQHDDNVWHYKFSWNPRNVVVAGQSTAKFLYQNKLKIVPYQRLFAEAETVHIPTMGDYEIYPNRDSLSYLELYNLENIPTLLRATIRHKGYSEGWNVLLQLGLTDDSYKIANSHQLTYREYFLSFLPAQPFDNQQDILNYLSARFYFDINGDLAKKLIDLQLWDNEPVGLHNASPAQILQQRLEKLWVLQPYETDLVIMQHEFIYILNNKKYLHLSTLVQTGQNATFTAMSQLVGLPLAIAVKQFLLGNIQLVGVHIPTLAQVYEPILAELADLGVIFKEQITEIE